MSFQTVVNAQQAPARPGDFASTNPRHTVVAGQGQLVAGAQTGVSPAGINIGVFGWIDSTGTTVVNNGSGVPDGVIANEGQALITTYLGETSYVIPQGFPVTVYDSADIFMKNAGSGSVTRGMKAFASLTTGQVQFAATGATISGYIETGWYAAQPALTGELVPITTHYAS